MTPDQADAFQQGYTDGADGRPRTAPENMHHGGRSFYLQGWDEGAARRQERSAMWGLVRTADAADVR